MLKKNTKKKIVMPSKNKNKLAKEESDQATRREKKTAKPAPQAKTPVKKKKPTPEQMEKMRVNVRADIVRDIERTTMELKGLQEELRLFDSNNAPDPEGVDLESVGVASPQVKQDVEPAIPEGHNQFVCNCDGCMAYREWFVKSRAKINAAEVD